MTDREIVKAIMTAGGISNAALARQLGITDAAMWDRLNNKKNKSLSTNTLRELLQPLGYKLVVLPEDAPVPEGGFPVN